MPNLIVSTLVDNLMQSTTPDAARVVIGAPSTQQISDIQTQLSEKLPAADPQMTGSPTVNGHSILTDSTPVNGGTW